VRANSLQAFGTGLQTPSRLGYLKAGIVPAPDGADAICAGFSRLKNRIISLFLFGLKIGN